MEHSKRLIKKAFFPILTVLILFSCNKNENSIEELPDYGMNNAFVHYSIDVQPSFTTIKAITEDDSGNIWFAGGGIIVKYDGNKMNNITEEFDLDFSNLYCCYKDSDNTIWFGTGSGVLKINCDSHDYSIYTEDDGLVSNDIRDILRDDQGNYWFASYHTTGLTKFDGINWTIIDYTVENIGWVRNMFQDTNETFWFAAMGNGVHKLHDTIWTTYKVKSGARSIIGYNSEIIAGPLRGVQKFDNENWIDFLPEIDSADILCMMIDHNNYLWFGNYNDYLGYGLAKYNGTTLEKISIKNNVNIDRVWTIFEDSKSIIWVGGRGIASIQN